MKQPEVIKYHPENRYIHNVAPTEIVEDVIRCVYILRKWYGISRSPAVFKMQNEAWQLEHFVAKTEAGTLQNTYILSHGHDGTYMVIQDNAKINYFEFSYPVVALKGGRKGYFDDWTLFTPYPLEGIASVIVPVIESLVMDTARIAHAKNNFFQRFSRQIALQFMATPTPSAR